MRLRAIASLSLARAAPLCLLLLEGGCRTGLLDDPQDGGGAADLAGRPDFAGPCGNPEPAAIVSNPAGGPGGTLAASSCHRVAQIFTAPIPGAIDHIRVGADLPNYPI